MSFQTLDTKIKAKLDSLTGAGQPLNFNYQANLNGNFEGYPCAVFVKSDNEADYENQADNLRTYVYHIYIIQEVESTDVADADDILSEATDIIMNAFDDDYTLGGTILKSRAIPTIWGTLDMAGGQASYARITLAFDVVYELN